MWNTPFLRQETTQRLRFPGEIRNSGAMIQKLVSNTHFLKQEIHQYSLDSRITVSYCKVVYSTSARWLPPPAGYIHKQQRGWRSRECNRKNPPREALVTPVRRLHQPKERREDNAQSTAMEALSRRLMMMTATLSQRLCRSPVNDYGAAWSTTTRWRGEGKKKTRLS